MTRNLCPRAGPVLIQVLLVPQWIAARSGSFQRVHNDSLSDEYKILVSKLRGESTKDRNVLVPALRSATRVWTSRRDGRNLYLVTLIRGDFHHLLVSMNPSSNLRGESSTLNLPPPAWLTLRPLRPAQALSASTMRLSRRRRAN